MTRDTVSLDRLDELWDFGDAAASEARFSALRPRAEREGDGARLAELLSQIARAQGLQGRFENAEATLAEAEAALLPSDARGRVRLLLERGRIANTAGRDGRGAAHFRHAWERARSTGEDGLAVDAAHMLGIVEPPDEARAWNERAMELARSSDDPAARRWIGSLANNMGWARHDLGDDQSAIALFELSRDAFLTDGREDRARIARWSIARCLRSRGDVEAALALQRTLLDELDALGQSDGYVLEELGECLLVLGREADARPFFARAFAELSGDPAIRDDEPERLRRLASLGHG